MSVVVKKRMNIGIRSQVRNKDWWCYDKLIDSITKKRKFQYYDDGEYYHNYLVNGENNPCGCGSNVYHLEYDGKKIYGVCNACNTDIYEYKDEYIEEELKQGIWK